MKNRINPFLRAHGFSAGPLMRPRWTGFLAGACAGFLVFVVFWNFQVLQDYVYRFGTLRTFLGYLFLGALNGIIYGLIYRRAANDHQGGWIFGASSGFILWMINPIIWWPWLGHPPLFVGQEALIFLISHIFFGFVLGLLFPWMNRLTSRSLRNVLAGPVHVRQDIQSQ